MKRPKIRKTGGVICEEDKQRVLGPSFIKHQGNYWSFTKNRKLHDFYTLHITESPLVHSAHRKLQPDFFPLGRRLERCYTLALDIPQLMVYLDQPILKLRTDKPHSHTELSTSFSIPQS